MKKILLSMLMLGTLYSEAIAQSKDVVAKDGRGWYIKGGASYFITVTPVEFPNVGSLQPRVSTGTLVPTVINGVTTLKEVLSTDKTITGSFGQGYRFNATPGYSFNKYLAFEVGLHFFHSDKHQMAKKTLADGVNPAQAGTTALSIDATGKVFAFDISPNVVFKFPLNNGFEPYTKVGVIVPIHGRLKISTDIYDRYGATTGGSIANLNLHREEEIVPRPTIGFLGALGVNYPVAKKVAAYAEVEYRNVAVSSKSKELTAYSGTGVNPTNGQPVALSFENLEQGEKFTDYKTSLNTSSNTEYVLGTTTRNPNFDKTKNAEDLRSYINIGGLGFSVGVKVSF
ncbi:porin family protein [Solitalea sp. MAHUQ-68]|uniref:Porin family protein n=1 Tax=Solitalea agri TaxID=2953739 RepID=A0A9X2F3S1_9SPHI|nr:outer membrane beta-barrel protein [Solitalea agri]MCO4293700.1 porin family protein [Solitalea agri]